MKADSTLIPEKKGKPRIAIMSAMAEENASLVNLIAKLAKNTSVGSSVDVDSNSNTSSLVLIESGMRKYHCGNLWGHDVVVVFSHWGKVAAASTASFLINSLNVDEIIFTGVAGAVNTSLKVGDIVVGNDLYQHDMDASPIIERHEIPLLGTKVLPSCNIRRPQLKTAAEQFISESLHEAINEQTRAQFKLDDVSVHVGNIASGDQFISDSATLDDIRHRLPDTLCVEMEGAAVAQVCAEHQIPFSIVRTISDTANEDAPMDFPQFIESVAQCYSLAIIENLLSAQ